MSLPKLKSISSGDWIAAFESHMMGMISMFLCPLDLVVAADQWKI
jgi:hypothetical protein